MNEKTRKSLALFLALALIFGLLPQMELRAQAATDSGNCGAEGDGSNLSWSFDEATGVLTISGSGDMHDYSFDHDKAPWHDHCEKITSVLLPQGLTSIGGSAFEYCSSLTSVEIPDSVTSIGDLAFWACSSLTSVEIPNSVTSISVGAFGNCGSLTGIQVAADNPNYCSEDGVMFKATPHNSRGLSRHRPNE